MADARDLGALPPLREVVAQHGLRANKSFGQHYLFDQNLTDRIAREAGPLEDATLIEIGPGPGGLTRSLLRTGAAHVVAIEKDRRFLPALAELGEAVPGALTVIEADALGFDYAGDPRIPRTRPLRVAANLPYNVGTQLLIDWLLADRFWESLTLMFQQEVAERVVAAPGSDAYGRLAVLAQLRARPHWVTGVPAAAFTPPPKVESAVVRLDPLPQPYGETAALGHVTAAAFGQRRKMLRRSLKPVFADVEAALAACGIEGTTRPETLPPEAFARLADYAVSRRSD